jgi:hypothetical protein
MNVYLTVEVVGKRFRLMLRWPDVVLHSCRLDGMVEAKALQEQQSPPAYMPGGRWYSEEIIEERVTSGRIISWSLVQLEMHPALSYFARVDAASQREPEGDLKAICWTVSPLQDRLAMPKDGSCWRIHNKTRKE